MLSCRLEKRLADALYIYLVNVKLLIHIILQLEYITLIVRNPNNAYVRLACLSLKNKTKIQVNIFCNPLLTLSAMILHSNTLQQKRKLN